MLFALLLILVVTTIFFIRRKYSYWERKGVPGPKPWPLFGNIFEIFVKNKTTGQIFNEIYKKYDEYPVVGAYRTTDAVLIVRDPEFITRMFVKDSKYFFNNDFYVDKKIDPLQGSNPFFQKDGQWKETRTTLSPAFTGNKMRSVFNLIEKVNQRLINHLQSRPDINQGHTLDTLSLCRRYTLENVALTAFGIDGKNFEQDPSDFMDLANSYIGPGTFFVTMLQMFPLVGGLISLKVIPKEIDNTLIKIITDVVKHRDNNGIVVNDYLQYVSDLRNKKDLSYTEMTGHAAAFLEDGYETSAITMSYVLFNLSQYPEAQERVRSEIKLFEEKNSDKKINYDDLSEMTYLNACIYESMRVCPVLSIYTRLCSDPYIYTTASDAPEHLKRMTVNLDAGMVCIIPFAGLCHDERYFPEPKKFIPERFLDKDNNGFKGLFYPFGGGHRVCLGQRFGLLQVRMGIIEVIKNFEVTFSSKTKLPFEFMPWSILNKVKNGVWLTYKKL